MILSLRVAGWASMNLWAPGGSVAGAPSGAALGATGLPPPPCDLAGFSPPAFLDMSARAPVVETEKRPHCPCLWSWAHLPGR